MTTPEDALRALAEQWVGVKGDQAGRSTLAELSAGVLSLLDRLAAAEAAPLDVERPEDARWVAALRDTPLYQCGYWLGGERICMLPNGHEKHTDEYTALAATSREASDE